MNSKYYKLIILCRFLKATSLIRQDLIDNSINTASDNILFMRRARMLGHLAEFEAQGIAKIYNFDTCQEDDFFEGLDLLISEAHSVTFKNA